MPKIVRIDRELAPASDEVLVLNGLVMLFSSDFDRFERRLSDSEKLAVASSLTALTSPLIWLSAEDSQGEAATLEHARNAIDRQMEAEGDAPPPAYDSHPPALYLSAVFDELIRRRDNRLEIARANGLSAEMLREYA